MQPVSIYIHWPFCESKCPYCDFNSHVRESIDSTLYLQSYLKELSHYSTYLSGKTVTSIFFGGGTPSLAPPEFFSGALNSLHQITSLAHDVEITLEANPGSAERKKFQQFVEIGINRISIGVQSFNDEALKFLGRKHSAAAAIQAIDCAAQVLDNYSFDLIYALPWHNLENWAQELQVALQYARNHLSLYQLTIEKGTKFFQAYNLREFTLPEEELAAQLYTTTNALLKEHGFDSYEVSNYAKNNYKCRHNLTYWEYGDYIGIGPGAHGRITENNSKKATMNYHSPEKWVERLSQNLSPQQYSENLSEAEQKHERLLMGLRMTDGIDAAFLQADSSVAERLESMLSEKLLVCSGEKIKTSERGRLVLNSILNFLLQK